MHHAGLLQIQGAENATAEVEGDDALLDRATAGTPKLNFSFPIMPSTEEEWKNWERQFALSLNFCLCLYAFKFPCPVV